MYEDGEDVKADEQPVLVGLLENGRLKAPEYDWKFFAQMAMYVDKNQEELQALVSKCAPNACCTGMAVYPSVRWGASVYDRRDALPSRAPEQGCAHAKGFPGVTRTNELLRLSSCISSREGGACALATAEAP